MVRNFGVHVREQLGHGDDVAHARNIVKMDVFIGEQSGGHRGQRGVFRAADADDAFEPAASVDVKAIH